MNLSHLKPGDTVAIRRHEGSFSRLPSQYVIAKVLEVGKAKTKTDKGDFKTSNGDKWGESPYYCDFIQDITIEEALRSNEEREKEIKRIKMVREVLDGDFNKLSIDQLETIKAMFS